MKRERGGYELENGIVEVEVVEEEEGWMEIDVFVYLE
jgi:hypothetical protein